VSAKKNEFWLKSSKNAPKMLQKANLFWSWELIVD
jgi:hypothetical protein